MGDIRQGFENWETLYIPELQQTLPSFFDCDEDPNLENEFHVSFI